MGFAVTAAFPAEEQPMGFVLMFVVFATGVAAFVYGGADDSPGLQLLGALLALGAVAFAVRRVRRRT
jgi:MYXO-CTERM domain-containing protein